MTAWRAAHLEEIRAKDRAYRASHKEEIRAYLAAHQEESRSTRAAYYASHKEEMRAKNANRVSLAGKVVHIETLPEELRPIARLIQETRREIRQRRSA